MKGRVREGPDGYLIEVLPQGCDQKPRTATASRPGAARYKTTQRERTE